MDDPSAGSQAGPGAWTGAGTPTYQRLRTRAKEPSGCGGAAPPQALPQALETTPLSACTSFQEDDPPWEPLTRIGPAPQPSPGPFTVMARETSGWGYSTRGPQPISPFLSPTSLRLSCTPPRPLGRSPCPRVLVVPESLAADPLGSQFCTDLDGPGYHSCSRQGRDWLTSEQGLPQSPSAPSSGGTGPTLIA